MEKTIETTNAILKDILMTKGNDSENLNIEKDSSLADDLGFTSLDLAQMIVELQEQFDYDPLSNGVLLSDITKVGDLYRIFHMESVE